MAGARPRRRPRPLAERLESRQLLATCSTISGFVYNDANNNGKFDPGELPVANSTVELHDSTGALVATTTSAADGSYSFMTDPRISTAPQTLVRTASLPLSDTDFNQTLTIPKFDPALGTLTSVQIQSQVTIQSRVRAENLGPTVQTGVTASVHATVTLSGPGIPSGSLDPNLSIDVGPATLQPNDGSNPTTTVGGVVIVLPDFSGPDTQDFGTKTNSSIMTTTLTDAASLAAYTGTGNVSLTAAAQAVNSNTGDANVAFDFKTQAAESALSVIYTFIPNNCLMSGQYTVVEASQPSGTFLGKSTSSAGRITPPPATGNPSIPIPFTQGTDSPNNNFALLLPASIGGFVYHDVASNGVKDAVDNPIPGTKITLTGTDDLGASVSLTTTTNSSGAYGFTGLRPGKYTVTETQPNGYLQGKNSVGTVNGVTDGTLGPGTDVLSTVILAQADSGINYNFGEVLPVQLSGYVYVVRGPDDGIRRLGVEGLPGSNLKLTGTDDLGASVMLTTTAGAQGFYSFTNLRPGVYTVIETGASLPSGPGVTWQMGQSAKENVPIGKNSVISTVDLRTKDNSPNNNFSWLKTQNQDFLVGPTVTAFARYGIHSEPIRLLVTFSRPLDRASATNVSNYRLVRIGTNVVIPIRVVSYDDATRTVTLAPVSNGLNEYFDYQLTVNKNITNKVGMPLNSDSATNPQGRDTVIKFNHTAIVGETTKTGKLVFVPDMQDRLKKYFPAINKTTSKTVAKKPAGPVSLAKSAAVVKKH
jgi:hypothetical protein